MEAASFPETREKYRSLQDVIIQNTGDFNFTFTFTFTVTFTFTFTFTAARSSNLAQFVALLST
jgi:hypothetical protein